MIKGITPNLVLPCSWCQCVWVQPVSKARNVEPSPVPNFSLYIPSASNSGSFTLRLSPAVAPSRSFGPSLPQPSLYHFLPWMWEESSYWALWSWHPYLCSSPYVCRTIPGVIFLKKYLVLLFFPYKITGDNQFSPIKVQNILDFINLTQLAQGRSSEKTRCSHVASDWQAGTR